MGYEDKVFFRPPLGGSEYSKSVNFWVKISHILQKLVFFLLDILHYQTKITHIPLILRQNILYLVNFPSSETF